MHRSLRCLYVWGTLVWCSTIFLHLRDTCIQESWICVFRLRSRQISSDFRGHLFHSMRRSLPCFYHWRGFVRCSFALLVCFGLPWCGVQPFSCTSVIRVFKNHGSACLDCVAGKFLATSGATSSTQCAGLCVACIIGVALWCSTIVVLLVSPWYIRVMNLCFMLGCVCV